MRWVEVTTQTQLDKLKPGEGAIVREVTAYGSAAVWACDSAAVWACGSATVWASGSATVRASGSATVRASGSATVRAYDSATVRAYDSATVRAYDSATVRASGSATVWACDSATVRAGRFTAVHHLSDQATVTGGVVIRPKRDTPEDWCGMYGLTSKRGFVTLYKAVQDDWRGTHKHDGITYRPGDKPVAPDFDGAAECGGGLHLSPHAFMAARYCDPVAHYVACKVRVADMVLIDDKVKVKSCRVLHECDVDGVPL